MGNLNKPKIIFAYKVTLEGSVPGFFHSIADEDKIVTYLSYLSACPISRSFGEKQKGIDKASSARALLARVRSLATINFPLSAPLVSVHKQTAINALIRGMIPQSATSVEEGRVD